MHGKGERRYPDSSIYKGEFQNGERHGYGELHYTLTGEWYKGYWHFNVRQGQGTLYSKDKNTYTVRNCDFCDCDCVGGVQGTLAEWGVYDIVQ